jgi:predicted hotdog family 3-hydroxylacyl-ACP dehydratase
MCLLDRVDAWDEEHISCTASSHRAPKNPLRGHDRLGSACGIEYAAQAMAAHGSLCAAAASSPRAGYLASVRGVELRQARLDDVDANLVVQAKRLSGNDNTVLYAFSISAGGRLLLNGRATVVLNAASMGVQP